MSAESDNHSPTLKNLFTTALAYISIKRCCNNRTDNCHHTYCATGSSPLPAWTIPWFSLWSTCACKRTSLSEVCRILRQTPFFSLESKNKNRHCKKQRYLITLEVYLLNNNCFINYWCKVHTLMRSLSAQCKIFSIFLRQRLYFPVSPQRKTPKQGLPVSLSNKIPTVMLLLTPRTTWASPPSVVLLTVPAISL